MSTERPSKGLLVFQCDVCFDTFELSKEEHNISDFRSCWSVLKEEGWTIRAVPRKPGSNESPEFFKSGLKHNGYSSATEHLCADCSKTARADRDNPFRR